MGRAAAATVTKPLRLSSPHVATPPDRSSGRPAAWGLLVAVALMVLAMGVPAVTGWNVRVNSFPPLHAEWDPRVGWGTVPAIVLAALGFRHAAGSPNGSPGAGCCSSSSSAGLPGCWPWRSSTARTA